MDAGYPVNSLVMSTVPLTTDNLLNIASLLLAFWGVYLTKQRSHPVEYKKNPKSGHQTFLDDLSQFKG